MERQERNHRMNPSPIPSTLAPKLNPSTLAPGAPGWNHYPDESITQAGSIAQAGSITRNLESDLPITQERTEAPRNTPGAHQERTEATRSDQERQERSPDRSITRLNPSPIPSTLARLNPSPGPAMSNMSGDEDEGKNFQKISLSRLRCYNDFQLATPQVRECYF